MPPRILQIIPTLDRAGAEKQLVLLARGLPQGEFEVHVAALTRGGPRAVELAASGVPVRVIGKRFKADPVAFYRLEQHIRQLRPDLVHTWLFAAGAYGRGAARRAGVRHLIAGERCVDRWKSAWQWALDRRLARVTDRIVTNSPAVRDYCVEHGLPAERFAVIANAVPPAAESELSRGDLLRELGLPPAARLIGCVGRLWPQKRVKDLIWAADLIRVLEDNMRFLIIGDGPQRGLLERYARLVSDLEHVRFLGERDDVARILPHLDVLWQGSGYEGQPNAVLEAMAAGVPVVASDIPGHRELMDDGRTGFLVPVAGRAARVRVTDRLLRDGALAQQIGQAARCHVGEHFGVERMVQQYAALYREVLADD